MISNIILLLYDTSIYQIYPRKTNYKWSNFHTDVKLPEGIPGAALFTALRASRVERFRGPGLGLTEGDLETWNQGLWQWGSENRGYN